MPASFADDLRADARAGGSRARRGLWLSFLGAYGLEALLGPAAVAARAERSVDWLGVDLQHGELDERDLPALLRVAERASVPILVRLRSHDPASVARLIDAGVDGVIVPSVESATQAEALVRAMRLPPHGARSTGMARSAFGLTGEAEPLLLPMVETATGLAVAAEILAVDGVDGVFVGPYDLSMSLGSTPADPRIHERIRRVAATARRAGKVVGLYAGRPDLLALAAALDLVALDSDVTALRLGLDSLLGRPGVVGS